MSETLQNLQKITWLFQSVRLDDMEKLQDLNLGIEWLSILKSGITMREIMALQNVMGTATLKQIGDQIGVTPERIRCNRERALRRLRHPVRKPLAKLMPEKLHIAVYGRSFTKP